ncbi:hypothetical protein [Chryseobacterium sp. ERMR1:04]|uniref:hypothetical protein n=1 Tax=Chryseobacterium sp. ERMR1:04 TaxID=1705393 RepID=UPI0006C8BA29|nr:hypothetical protein [Chryseobacterium sp. ERMR1:04]KPH11684.1 hypothetical protein AMQ68_20110 [Chryseobacterium sp. ERMR1:04]
MLKINSVKVEINTDKGLFGADFTFESGLNIIRGNNTAGKSSLFQSIIYALGFEELLGGKFEKTLQSVLKDTVEYPREKNQYKILQSFVYLVVENQSGEVITVRRGVRVPDRKSQLIDVYYGDYISEPENITQQKQMWVHDKGGASDNDFGFHAFLCEFINLELPKVVTYNGNFTSLYLQQIASAFIIEQKKGWSDFFITAPIYSIRDLNQRIVEFLLNLDVFENNEKKELINTRRNKLQNDWQKTFNDLESLAERTNTKIVGVKQTPELINNINDIKLILEREAGDLRIEDYFSELQNELLGYSDNFETVGDNISANERLLNDKQNLLNKFNINYDILLPEISVEESKLVQFERQHATINEDLRKNKGVQKLNRLGAKNDLKITENKCPTCSQEIKDLLPSDINHTPMRLEDNISYLESQVSMIKIYIDGQKKSIQDKQKQAEELRNEAHILRKEIRDLKKELVEDERIPSIIQIEKKFSLTQRVNLFRKAVEKLEDIKNQFSPLIDSYGKLLTDVSGLPTLNLSALDEQKIKDFEENFISYLRKFGYKSKSFDAIKLSRDTYFPIVDGLYNIKFDSSASDFIRCIWSYTISLMKTSVAFGGNHPQVLIFDEPKQQDISLPSFKTFLQELAKFKNQQVFVFASFENSDKTFTDSTDGITFKLSKIEETLIKPIL